MTHINRRNRVDAEMRRAHNAVWFDFSRVTYALLHNVASDRRSFARCL